MARPGGNPDRPPLPPSTGRPKGSKNKLTRERVEQELRHIAFSDPIALFERVHKGKRTFKLRELADMSPEMRRAIASVKVRRENLTSGDKAQDETVEIRLWEKTKALELCARALGMLKDRIELTVSDEVLDRLDAWKARNRIEGLGLPAIESRAVEKHEVK